MDIWYTLMTPFTWLLLFFYKFFNSYGLALILFALVVKLILFPLSLKGKRSMIQMNMLSGKMQKLQKQYGKDPSRYNAEVQKLYEKEGVNPMGGCLWSFLPLLILLPLYAIIRQPMKYMMGMTYQQIVDVGNSVLNWANVAAANGWIKEAAPLTEAVVKAGYNQLYLASLITPDNVARVIAAAGETAGAIIPVNFSFFGVSLAQVPQLKFWQQGLEGFGLLLIPLISAGTSILFSVISLRTNNLNSSQKNEQAEKTSRMMMLITPLMSLWIGFSMPAALSIYWIANNVLGLGQELICGKLLKKDYEKAAELAKQRELEEKEEEKRLRREKAEQKAREAEEARKNKGKKKEKEPDEAKMTPQQREAARVGIRQYARGRAYDPDRFGGVTPYHEDVAARTVEKIMEDMAAVPEETVAPETTGPVEDTPETAVLDASPSQADEAPAEESPAEGVDLAAKLQAEIDATLAGDEGEEPKED